MLRLSSGPPIANKPYWGFLNPTNPFPSAGHLPSQLAFLEQASGWRREPRPGLRGHTERNKCRSDEEKRSTIHFA